MKEDTDPINLYEPRVFTSKFMPSPELVARLKGDVNKFLIVRVEDMYKHVTRPVPATRATIHSMLFLTSGAATMKIGSDTYTIQPGQVLIVPAGQVFSFCEKDVNRGYLCSFHDDFLIGKFSSERLKDFEFLRVWGNPRISLDAQTGQFVEHLFSRILLDYAEYGLNNLDIIQPYLITLLCEINRAYTPMSGSTQTSAVSLTNRFKELLFTHVRTHHRVTDYATLLHITPNHLNKTVKAITGKSPTKWIDEAIVLEAKVLLSQRTTSISLVAADVGFTDQAYFTRLFKKQEGITPSTFQKMIDLS
ncbi:AraC family transcriptional regulator [Spirosoma sp. KUDC1026]|uniref:AraC family transcriptional regulator n=1 Tax=Spirosoma sp. KUDC1026 TaxID=2745947 RepID=UPI00159B843B|nr:helix-turn-helix transcriptional regulator [Spirosoma sp. KUDC1026]QKZ13579.1 helix-turn-helix domain-containing protein [Spirosoma sp. KUDC1026]